MKISLSLFDGMSCGQIALQRAGMPTEQVEEVTWIINKGVNV